MISRLIILRIGWDLFLIISQQSIQTTWVLLYSYLFKKHSRNHNNTVDSKLNNQKRLQFYSFFTLKRQNFLIFHDHHIWLVGCFAGNWEKGLQEMAYSKLRKGRFGGMVRRSHPSAQQNRQVFLAHLCFILIINVNISSPKSDRK